MTYALVFISIVVFAVLLRAFHLTARAGEIISLCRQSAAVLRDSSLDDLEKEHHARTASGTLFKKFAVVTVLGTAAFVASLSVPILASVFGLISIQAFVAASMSWQMIALTSAVLIIAFLK